MAGRPKVVSQDIPCPRISVIQAGKRLITTGIERVLLMIVGTVEAKNTGEKRTKSRFMMMNLANLGSTITMTGRSKEIIKPKMIQLVEMMSLVSETSIDQSISLLLRR